MHLFLLCVALCLAPQSVRTPRTRQVDESMNAFRSKEECLLELLASEERYLEALTKFTSVSRHHAASHHSPPP
jgi:hypothetical protein